jgi:hypothetical protein
LLVQLQLQIGLLWFHHCKFEIVRMPALDVTP